MDNNEGRKKTAGDYLTAIFVVVLAIILIPLVFIVGGVIFKYVLIAAGIYLIYIVVKAAIE